MITPSVVNYSEEIIENLSASDIREIYAESLLIWLYGSGSGSSYAPGRFYCVLDYKGNTRFMEGEINGASANAAMIEGFREAIISLKKPIHILLLTPCPLGFKTGFHGKGPNADRMQAALEKVKEKGCSLSASVITGNLIKQFVMKVGGKPKKSNENKYKKMIYAECLEIVCKLLQESGVEPSVIDKVRQISVP